jgi:hypothetical protein
MTMIRTTATVSPDGTVTVPVGQTEVGRTVEVTVSSIVVQTGKNAMPREEWWALLEQTAGSIDDPKFERPSQTYFDPPRVDN